MATFLTTRKMPPALAARVEASVRGRRGGDGGHGGTRGARRAATLIAVARVGVLVAIAAVVCAVLVSRRRDRRELERSRAAILASVRAESGSLTADDRSALARDEAWLVRFAGAYDAYEGDFVADELRAPGAFAGVLARQTVYVRGQQSAFANAAAIAEASAASAKDPFVLCLLDPPASRVEKALLAKVRAAYSGGPLVEEPTANVRRLREAEVGLPFLLPPWEERVRAAHEPEELALLQRDLEKAPVARARQALRAASLLVVIDEPGDGKGPIELDGERPHQVRIGLVDLAAARVLVRLRKAVDPSWISPSRRPVYASGLDGCALAMDVRDAVSAAPSPTASRVHQANPAPL